MDSFSYGRFSGKGIHGQLLGQSAKLRGLPGEQLAFYFTKNYDNL